MDRSPKGVVQVLLEACPAAPSMLHLHLVQLSTAVCMKRHICVRQTQ